MAWIESHQSLSRHRKTLAVTSALKADRHKILGHLHELWWWGLDNADINGVMGEVSHQTIAEAAGWPIRQASMFVGALIDAGFIETTDEGLVLHDWYEFAGKLNAQRAANRERMQRARAAHDDPPPTSTEETRAPHVQRTNGARAPATVPNRTGPNLTGENRVIPPAPTGQPPKGNLRVAAVIDAFRAFTGEHEPSMNDRDRSAIKHSTAPPELIAETYLAVDGGEWGDDFQKQRLTVHEACDWVNAYARWRDENGIEPMARHSEAS